MPPIGFKTSANIMLALTVLLFIGGICFPLVTIEKFVIAKHTVSILGGLENLWADGQWFLFSLIAVFSLCFPLWKLYAIYAALNPRDGKEKRCYVAWVASYGKWSMLDVFAAALLVVIVKLGAVVQIYIREGAYLFFVSVILSMLLSGRVLKHARIDDPM